jgi:hypothetical protein
MSIPRMKSSHKFLTRMAICLAFSSLSMPTFASSNVTSPVVGLYPYTAAAAKATLIFVATALPTGTEGCPAHTPANMVYLDMTDAQASTIYATLLAGFLTGAPMQIGISGCSSSGVPLVYQVLLGSQT